MYGKYGELLILVFRWFGYIDLPIPDRGCTKVSRMPNRKERTMFPTLTRFARFIDNYRFYRRRGFHFRAAWQLANMTLPE